MTQAAPLLEEPVGPLRRTVMELMAIERAAAFRRRHRVRARLRVSEADILIGLVEECRLKLLPIVPPTLWVEVVRFVGGVNSDLREALAADRTPDHVSDILYEVQRILLDAASRARIQPPHLAQIIPLFRPADSAAGSGTV
jgi:hypothetical protein